MALLMTASGSLDIFLTRLLRMKLFRNFPSTRLQKYQQHHAAPEVALTARRMSLNVIKENSDIYHCFKLLILLKNAHVSKLVTLKVFKYIIWLSRKYN